MEPGRGARSGGAGRFPDSREGSRGRDSAADGLRAETAGTAESYAGRAAALPTALAAARAAVGGVEGGAGSRVGGVGGRELSGEVESREAGVGALLGEGYNGSMTPETLADVALPPVPLTVE